jgi:ABC-type multidrug transport system fused ATPase/permease subunit
MIRGVTVEQNKKLYRRYLISFLASILIFTGIIIFIFLSSMSTNLQMSLLLLVLVLLLISGIWFRPRLYYHALELSFIKLKEQSIPPISVKHDLSSKAWLTYLTKKQFKVYQEQESYIVLHRFTQDSSTFITKSPMLEVIIVIRDEKLKFDHPIFAQKVNELEKEYLTTKKVRFSNYSMIHIKYSDTFTDELKDGVDQVVFDKHGKHHVTLINGFYHTKDQTLYFLHSKKYVPTLYYKYVVDLILSLTK